MIRLHARRTARERSGWRQPHRVSLIRRYQVASADGAGEGCLTSRLLVTEFPIGAWGEPFDLVTMVTSALFIRLHRDVAHGWHGIIYIWRTKQQFQMLRGSNSMRALSENVFWESSSWITLICCGSSFQRVRQTSHSPCNLPPVWRSFKTGLWGVSQSYNNLTGSFPPKKI